MQDDIFRFDVAVDDPAAMELLDSSTDLLHQSCSLDLVHGFSPFEFFVELAAGCEFQDDAEMLLVVEAAVHLDDVGVIQKHLDF